ncbi:hypothetical protein SAMN05216388_1017105 [Halorientalis persicus]|uniref:Restriction endonuclease n=1 Tax=Halorientalis persicus TaxID=1367881 RepID=A0A1H8S174_9EURY|nr:hypothetical protein [Halorientalis persicus]SEO72194.1 hypothetical protein SAMN05216388_1017105 [Halorientalis persicus]
MSGVDEADFHDRVVAQLRDAFGDDRVRSEVWLDGPERRLDVAVDLPELGTGLAVELEDRPADCIHGAGQALVYARTLGYLPVVGYPAAAADGDLAPELDALSERVQVVAL